MSKKKKLKIQHVTYNEKEFLSRGSILSMSAIHAKIKADGECSVRISDCNNSIKIWNNLNDKNQVKEMSEKLDMLISALSGLQFEIIHRYGIPSFEKSNHE